MDVSILRITYYEFKDIDSDIRQGICLRYDNPAKLYSNNVYIQCFLERL